MREIIGTAFALAFLVSGSLAQETPRAEIAGGFSHLEVLKGFTIAMEGGSGSVALNLNNWLGAVGDFGVYYSRIGGPGLTGETYTFGPRFSYRSGRRLVPYAQALFGGSHFSTDSGGISGGGTEFTFGVGGGGDLTVGRSGRFALRGQIEYFGIRAFGSTTPSVRLSAGIVYRIGRR